MTNRGGRQLELGVMPARLAGAAKTVDQNRFHHAAPVWLARPSIQDSFPVFATAFSDVGALRYESVSPAVGKSSYMLWLEPKRSTWARGMFA
jgi:hypothetical protein